MTISKTLTVNRNFESLFNSITVHNYTFSALFRREFDICSYHWNLFFSILNDHLPNCSLITHTTT